MNENNAHVVNDTKEVSVPKSKLSLLFLNIAVFIGGVIFIPISGVATDLVKTVFISVFVLLSLVLFCIPVLKKGTITLPKGLIFQSLALSVFITALSSLFSGVFKYSFWGYGTEAYTAGFVLVTFTAFILVFNLFNSEKRILQAWTYLGLMSSAVFLVSLIYYILAVLGKVTYTWSPTGPYADTAIILGLMLVIVSVGIQFFKLSLKQKIIGYVVFGLVLLLLGLTALPLSILWNLLAVVSVILFAVSILNFNKTHGNSQFSSKSAAAIPFIILFVISVLFSVIPTKIYNLAPRYIASNVTSNTGADWSVTKDLAWSTIKIDPVFGPGPNLLVKNSWNNRPASVNDSSFWNTDIYYAKGTIQTFMLSNGVLGMISWFVFFLTVFITGIRLILKARYEIKWSDLLSGVSLFYISLTLITYSGSVYLVFLSIILVALYLANKNSDNKHERVLGKGAIGKVLSIVLVVILLVSTVTYIYGLAKRVVAQNKVIYASKMMINNKLDEAESQVFEAAKLTGIDGYYKAVFNLEVGKLSEVIKNAPKNGAEDTDWAEKFNKALTNVLIAGNLLTESFPNNNTNLLTVANFYNDSASIKIPGAYDKAKSIYDSVISENPKSPATYYFLAKLEFNNGDVDSAISNLSKAIELKPSVIDFQLGLADIYLAKKDYEKTVEVLMNGIKAIAPSESQLMYDKLALVLYGTKQYDKAIPVFVRILQLPPQIQDYSYANVKYYLGLSLVKQGDFDNALVLFNDIKTTNQENTDLDRIISSIKAKKDPFPDYVPEVKQATTTAKKAIPTPTKKK